MGLALIARILLKETHYAVLFFVVVVRLRCFAGAGDVARDCTSRFFGSFVAVRLRSFDDVPFLSDQTLQHFDRKQRRELARCEEGMSAVEEMQEPRIMPQEEVPRPKSTKKKVSSQSAPSLTKKGWFDQGKAGFAGSLQSKKTSKRGLKADASQPPLQHTDGSASESLLDSASLGGDYRGLRHKYLVLEEESLSLDRALSMVEADIKDLENDKLGLLDQLVVLEGLIDPSELKSK
ncbi:hypothetical protein KFK09_007837 [Dendrobium nobile]|uniref:Uncharacterized protein n=1 Tax=Dendrobium nobile TaxID=94219 RepID=A0A8T3BSY6_DENNO|nr:hypothetical protein KFK09_007837 [Dendrobium nobile]